MYHCCLRFYLTGCRSEWINIIRNMPPLEGFTHEFVESGTPEAAQAARADVILAGLGGENASLSVLTENMRPEARLIVIREGGALPPLDRVDDLWPAPMPEEELRFRFLRWQQAYKTEKDAWEINQYLEAAINSTPTLVWYKTRDGVHEKVNDSFCRTVGKTKEQVQGQRHAYIWDVEQDDPACIESERVVMTEERTCVAEEMIQTGEGTRLLTTYKSPLYDLDGTVMGTVGVGIDVTQERAYEQEIIEKNRTLEMLFTTMDCGVMCHSLDGDRIISINRAALEILGYASKEEMLAAGFHMVADSVLDEDKSRLRDGICSLKKAGDTVNVEYRVQHKDGRQLHVVGNIKLVEENGELFYQRFLLDFTAQKQ